MRRTLSSAVATAIALLFSLALAEPSAAQALSPAGKRPPTLDAPPGPPRLPTAPPPGPVHCVAEWEESEGVLVLWKNADLIYRLQEDNEVYIPVNGLLQQQNWIAWLETNGIPRDRIQFLPIPTNSIYTRDYGPWFVWDATGTMGVVDYKPSYGYWDDLFPVNFARAFGIAYYDSGLHHVGGNYLPIGYDVAFSSTHVYEQNGNSTKAAVDTAMKVFFGIDPYRTVAPKSIWHHDTWGKPCDPDTLIVVDFPADNPKRRRQANDTAAFYATLESPWGRPFEILRLPMFKKSGNFYRPYMNSLVSNRRVYVPIDNHPDDRVALDVFARAFPGYEIVGVDSQGCFHFDAVHCRTRNFVRRDPLRIYPYPPGDTEDTVAGYTVTAEVIPPKGFSLLPGSPVVRWSDTGGAPFQALAMTPGPTPDHYEAVLPPRPHGTTVSLYVEAADDGGRKAIYPPVAPDGLMSFEVRADTQAPELSRFLPACNASADHWPPPLRVLSTDDMATPEVRVETSINGVPQPDVVLSREELCYWYAGSPAGSAAAGDLVTYRIEASDGAAAANTAQLPKLGRVYCPVRASTEVAVVNMSARPYTAPFLAATLGELDVPFTYYDQWPADWSDHQVWFVCLGVFADNHVLSREEAHDLVMALKGGARVYLEGGDAWCYDPQRATLNPWFGVLEVKRGPSMTNVLGVPGSIVEGLSLDYVGENLFTDSIAADPPGQLLFTTQPAGHGRAVMRDAGSYRTIASGFALGGLMDGAWPDTREGILLRYLEFLGVSGVRLTAAGTAQLGHTVPIRVEAQPGDQYVLLASLADYCQELPGLGLQRLDPEHLMRLAQGVVPSSGVVVHELRIPADADLLGWQVHVQALTGPQIAPGSAAFTNRDILTVVE